MQVLSRESRVAPCRSGQCMPSGGTHHTLCGYLGALILLSVDAQRVAGFLVLNCLHQPVKDALQVNRLLCAGHTPCRSERMIGTVALHFCRKLRFAVMCNKTIAYISALPVAAHHVSSKVCSTIPSHCPLTCLLLHQTRSKICGGKSVRRTFIDGCEGVQLGSDIPHNAHEGIFHVLHKSDCVVDIGLQNLCSALQLSWHALEELLYFVCYLCTRKHKCSESAATFPML